MTPSASESGCQPPGSASQCLHAAEVVRWVWSRSSGTITRTHEVLLRQPVCFIASHRIAAPFVRCQCIKDEDELGEKDILPDTLPRGRCARRRRTRSRFSCAPARTSQRRTRRVPAAGEGPFQASGLPYLTFEYEVP